MYWDMVLQEVLNNKKSKQPVSLTNIAELKKNNYNFPKVKKLSKSKPLKKHYLGEPVKSIYFTKREAECMVLLLKGRTINNTALEMKLSPRTVEFYLKNMKNKVGCRTKFELVEIVQNSEFMKNL